MGVDVKVLVKDDIKEIMRTWNKIAKENNLKIDFDSKKYNKEGYVFLYVGNRMVMLSNFNKAYGEGSFKKILQQDELPAKGRLLKTAKNAIGMSLGSNEQAIQLFTQFLRLHPTHGYIQIQDTARGRYIMVNEKGLVKTDKWGPLEMEVVKKMYGLGNKVKEIDNVDEIKKGDITKILYNYAYDNKTEVYRDVLGKVVNEMLVFTKDSVYLINGIDFRDLRDSKSYYTPKNVRELIQHPKAKDIGKNSFEDIFVY